MASELAFYRDAKKDAIYLLYSTRKSLSKNYPNFSLFFIILNHLHGGQDNRPIKTLLNIRISYIKIYINYSNFLLLDQHLITGQIFTMAFS